MKAYRFNDFEMSRVIWLKKCFESEGFDFSSFRNPEVYYADFADLDTSIKIQSNTNKDISPDYLGVYHYQLKNIDNEKVMSTELPFDCISDEGSIILFQDRIEKVCGKRGLNLMVENVNFVVLMHELGHWFTHWPKYSKFNWHRGFHRPLIFTKEGLAQLIAYWACGDDLKLLETMKCLSPQLNNTIDDTNPYGVYTRLIGRSMPEIIRKMGQIRKAWFMTDEKMLEFLLAEEIDLMKWLVVNKYTLESVSTYQEIDFIGIRDDDNNMDSEIMRYLFPTSDLSSGNGWLNRILSTNYNN